MHLYRLVFGLVFFWGFCRSGSGSGEVDVRIPLPLRLAAGTEETHLVNKYEYCPLKVMDLSRHPWIVQRCKKDLHCCEAIKDLLRILFFLWLHDTSSFLLPDSRTAAVCMDHVQRDLESQGIPARVFETCKLPVSSFVSGPQHCNGIQNLADFERAVNTTHMKQSCNGSARMGKFQCHKCVMAMANAFYILMKGQRYNLQCEMFVLMYVGGGVNAYQDLGPDAASCLLSLQNLPALEPLVASESNNHPNRRIKRKEIQIALAISIPAVAIILLLGIYTFGKRGKFCGGVARSNRVKFLQNEAQLLRESVDMTAGLAFFSISVIKESTGNFAASNVIGNGGFGTVYRGSLPDGSQIAIKRFKDSSTKGSRIFMNEVKVISNVKHRNLLPLKGYCIWSGESNNGRPEQEQQHQHFLVYDFMANGSLADYLFKGNEPCLSWPQRHMIAVGIARGLAYLHEGVRPSIIHRDVKAANVLLDEDLNPLVSDFGLAKFKVEDYDKSHYTTRAVGTMGYVAPEYALYGRLTDKSDVFSFGILLLELISGRRALDSSSRSLENLIISDWAYELIQKGRFRDVIDKRIWSDDIGARESMQRMALLALRCAHTRVACRPSIQQALLILEAIDRPLPEIISLSNMETGEAGVGGKQMGGLNWAVLPYEGERIYSASEMLLGAVSVDSYVENGNRK